MIYFTIKTKLKCQEEKNDMTAQCRVDRRRRQRDAGEKQCVNTEQRKLRALQRLQWKPRT